MKHSKEFSALLIVALMVLGVSIASCDNEEEDALVLLSKTESTVQILTMDSLEMSQDTSTFVDIPVSTDPIVPTDPFPVTTEDSLLMGYEVYTDTTTTVVPTDPIDPTDPFIPVTKEDSLLLFGVR